MSKRVINTGVPLTNIRYGNNVFGMTEAVTDNAGMFSFDWAWYNPLYVSVQKPNYIFSSSVIFKIPPNVSWGASSPFILIGPRQLTIDYFGLPYYSSPDVSDVVDTVVDVVDTVVEGVDKACNRWSMNVNEQTVKVSSMLDTNFKVGLRGLKWECPDNSKLRKDVSGNGFIEIGGKSFPFRIDNGSVDIKLNNFFDFNAVLAGFGVI